MSVGFESRVLIGVALVAAVVAVGTFSYDNSVELSVQAPQLTSATKMVQPALLQAKQEPEQPGQHEQLESLPVASVEDHLEDIGEVVSTMSKAALPTFAALFAVVAGFFLRKLSAHQVANSLKPMDMAANEETPLTRRGALTALAAFPFVAAGPAFAAKTGGRIGGGSGFRSFSSRARPVAPPVTGGVGGGAAVGGVTGGGAVYVAPSPPVIVGPPVVASPFGYGYGYPAVGFGFSTGELLALSALELGEAFVREQRRQEFIRQQLETQRKLGQDEAQIQALQQQLAEQNKVMQELQQAMKSKGVTAPAQ